MEIRKTLVLSTCHLTQGTLLQYEGAPYIANFQFGAYYYTETDYDDREVPDDLRTVLEFARKHKCDEVKFDRDGDVLLGLPEYDWS